MGTPENLRQNEAGSMEMEVPEPIVDLPEKRIFEKESPIKRGDKCDENDEDSIRASCFNCEQGNFNKTNDNPTPGERSCDVRIMQHLHLSQYVSDSRLDSQQENIRAIEERSTDVKVMQSPHLSQYSNDIGTNDQHENTVKVEERSTDVKVMQHFPQYNFDIEPEDKQDNTWTEDRSADVKVIHPSDIECDEQKENSWTTEGGSADDKVTLQHLSPCGNCNTHDPSDVQKQCHVTVQEGSSNVKVMRPVSDVTDIVQCPSQKNDTGTGESVETIDIPTNSITNTSIHGKDDPGFVTQDTCNQAVQKKQGISSDALPELSSESSMKTSMVEHLPVTENHKVSPCHEAAQNSVTSPLSQDSECVKTSVLPGCEGSNSNSITNCDDSCPSQDMSVINNSSSSFQQSISSTELKEQMDQMEVKCEEGKTSDEQTVLKKNLSVRLCHVLQRPDINSSVNKGEFSNGVEQIPELERPKETNFCDSIAHEKVKSDQTETLENESCSHLHKDTVITGAVNSFNEEPRERTEQNHGTKVCEILAGKRELLTKDLELEGPSLRYKRRRATQEELVKCPVCGASVRISELPAHFKTELTRLQRPSRGKGKGFGKKGHLVINHAEEAATEASHKQEREQLYQSVKKNRQSREKAKKPSRGEDETLCPICNQVISGTQEEINEHVDQCLAKVGDDQEVDIEGEGEEEGYEEYTWAGQTRIRTTTLVPGGLAGSGFQVGSKNVEDEDVDLNVDDDDVDTFGPAQYTESDLIPCSSEEPAEDKENKALRRAFLQSKNERVKVTPYDRTRWEQFEDCVMPSTSSVSCSEIDTLPSEAKKSRLTDDSRDEVIQSLKVKVREQEEMLSKFQTPKCLICMEPYQKACVSVQCWHVHCEECWLRTLGVKKLCPQCNMITSPSDLRRVFI